MVLEDMVVSWLKITGGKVVESSGFLKSGDFIFPGPGLDFTHKGCLVTHQGVEFRPVYQEGNHELTG